MKSSRSLNPSSKVQSWLPSDLVQNLLNLGVEEEANRGEPRSLFEQTKPMTIADKHGGGLLGSETSLEAASWISTEFNLPKPEKQAPQWQPAIRYNTAANAAEIATQMINDARRQADEIIHQAEIHAKQLAEQSYQDGWNSSLEEIKSHMETATTLIQEVVQWRDDLLTTSEPMVLEIVRAIAQTKSYGHWEYPPTTLSMRISIRKQWPLQPFQAPSKTWLSFLSSHSVMPAL